MTDHHAVEPPGDPSLPSPEQFGIGRLFWHMREAVVVAEAATGLVVLWNPAAEAIFGYSAAEIVGHSVEALIPEDLRATHRAGIARFAAAGKGRLLNAAQPVEFRARHQDGRTLTVELSLTTLEAVGVPGRYAMAIIRDITARKHAEAQAESIIEHAAEGIYRTTPTGRLLLANPALARICGYDTPAELMTDLVDVGRQAYLEHGRRAEFLRLMAEHGVVTGFESQIRRRDGRVIWISENARAVYDEQGVLSHYEGTVQDITARKEAEAERAARLQEQAARAAAETAAQRIAFLAEATMLFASSLDYAETLNQVARQVLPTLGDMCTVNIVETEGTVRRVAVAHINPHKEALVRDLEDRYPPNLQAPYGVAQALRTGQTILYPELPAAVLAGMAQDANHRRLLEGLGLRSVVVVPMVARGRTLGTLSFARTESQMPYEQEDVRLAEDLARRAAIAVDNARLYRQAQEAVSLRDTFLSVAAHELRTPLTPLRGSLQLLRRALERGAPAVELDHLVSLADQQQERLSRLVVAMLDISRIKSGKLSLELRPVDLVALTRNVVEQTQATWRPSRKIRVETPAAAVLLQADAVRLEQILVNLLENARKYAPPSRPILVRVQTAEGQAAVTVQDQGIGIPPDEQERIFAQFYRATNADPAVAGIGLGLFLAREIAEAHGGSLTVQSTIGVGSAFTISLPWSGPSPGAGRAPSARISNRCD